MGIWTLGPGATSGNDVFAGDTSDESADGLGGDDVLNGGAGEDHLFGNAGNDTIRPAAIDADSVTAGQQQFSFIGTDAFDHTAGEIRYDLIDNPTGTDYTIISLDTDGIADSQITLVGLVSLTQTDFVFGP